MADDATLRITAEVASAVSNISKLRQEYLAFGASYSKTTKEVSDAINRFSGDAVIRQAQTYAAAVKEIGGVARLTTSEQATLNNVVTAAIEKYRALGISAPRD